MYHTTWHIGKIQPNPKQADTHRPLTEPERLKLSESIQRHGLLQPIEVTADGTILDGHHRHEICTELGIDEVPVLVRDDLDGDDVDLRFFEANSERRQMDEVDLSRAIYHRWKVEGRNGGRKSSHAHFKKCLAAELGISKRSVDRHCQLYQTPDAIREAVWEKRLPLTTAVKYTSLPWDQRKALVNRIQRGADPRQAFRDALAKKQKPKLDCKTELCLEYVDMIDTLRELVPRLAGLQVQLVGLAGDPQDVIPTLESAVSFLGRMRDREQHRMDYDIEI